MNALVKEARGIQQLQRMGSDEETQGLDLGLVLDPLRTALLVAGFNLILYRFLRFDS